MSILIPLSLILWYILYVCLNSMQWGQHLMPSIVIADYSPAWPAMFEEEKMRILAVAGGYIQDIESILRASIDGGSLDNA